MLLVPPTRWDTKPTSSSSIDNFNDDGEEITYRYTFDISDDINELSSIFINNDIMSVKDEISQLSELHKEIEEHWSHTTKQGFDNIDMNMIKQWWDITDKASSYKSIEEALLDEK